MKYILLILLVSTLLSQSKYPVDTLVQSTKINILKKMGLLPISMWQRISYNSNYFNCQFYPSCSNYCANAIKQYGIVKGMVIGSERITRCNPFAIYYHMELDRPFYEEDGRLIDFFSQNQNIKTKKSPTFASILSIFPGAGRVYAGRKLDGIMGLWTVYLTASSAIYAHKNKNLILGPFLVGFAGITYFGEIYGAWRAAKYYQKLENNNI